MHVLISHGAEETQFTWIANMSIWIASLVHSAPSDYFISTVQFSLYHLHPSIKALPVSSFMLITPPISNFLLSQGCRYFYFNAPPVMLRSSAFNHLHPPSPPSYMVWSPTRHPVHYIRFSTPLLRKCKMQSLAFS